MTKRWSRLFELSRLRLRSKLALSLSLAALVPVVLVAAIGVGVILSNLERGLRQDADRQLDVGLNLVLRTVERLGDELFRLASSPDLLAALERDPAAVEELLRTMPMPPGLVQVTDASGLQIATRAIGGGQDRYGGIGLEPSHPLMAAARGYTRRVTLELVGDRIVARAGAPIVDGTLTLRGVTTISVPLDADFADRVKGALGSDVILADRRGHSWSTFRDTFGVRRGALSLGTPATPGTARGVRVISLDDAEYQVAWSRLVDHLHQPVGWFGVAVDRRSLAAAQRQAVRSMALGGLAALVFALALAMLLSRRLGRPIARLHTGALAVARGDLDHRIEVPPGDEIADLAGAFTDMTSALKENQSRLAARMREIVALHDAGRAVSAVIDLKQVMVRTVESIARTFDAGLSTLWLVEADLTAAATPPPFGLTLGAARARRRDGAAPMSLEESLVAAAPFQPIAREVASGRVAIRIASLRVDPRYPPDVTTPGLDGPLLATPLERQGNIAGVLLITRGDGDRPFGEADANLLATFADQAASAIDNARLYDQVRGASAELERKVNLRTAELTAMNAELGKTLVDLRDTQAQLILSERMAGLGLLVAGVAHEINSPTAAIRGSVDAFGGVVRRIAAQFATLAAAKIPQERHQAVLAMVDEIAAQIAARRMPTGPTVRQHARTLRTELEGRGQIALAGVAGRLAELGVTDPELEAIVRALGPSAEGAGDQLVDVMVEYLTDHVFLHRTVLTIQSAIHRIGRIVSALKSYSHLDQHAAQTPADLHEGLETTLTLFDYALRDISVHRAFGALPLVPIYVDELNQVWTNLIQNAVQATEGRGAITIETERRGDDAVVRIIDDGPGIPAAAQARIFDPFFTTKPKGEGSGLGLGIVRRIVDKHGGTIQCTSEPGRTCFEVALPIVLAVSARASATS